MLIFKDFKNHPTALEACKAPFPQILSETQMNKLVLMSTSLALQDLCVGKSRPTDLAVSAGTVLGLQELKMHFSAGVPLFFLRHWVSSACQ